MKRVKNDEMLMIKRNKEENRLYVSKLSVGKWVQHGNQDEF